MIPWQNEERNKQEQATRISNYWGRKHDQELRLSLISSVFSRWQVNAKVNMHRPFSSSSECLQDTIILRLRRELEQGEAVREGDAFIDT